MRTGGIEATMAAVALCLATMFHLPFILPSGDGAAFVGVHYLVPLLALAGFCATSAICRKSEHGSHLLIAVVRDRLVAPFQYQDLGAVR